MPRPNEIVRKGYYVIEGSVVWVGHRISAPLCMLLVLYSPLISDLPRPPLVSICPHPLLPPAQHL